MWGDTVGVRKSERAPSAGRDGAALERVSIEYNGEANRRTKWEVRYWWIRSGIQRQ
jgi:hypothetical protein